MPTDDCNSNNIKGVSSKGTTESLTEVRKNQQQLQEQEDYSHKGENRHGKNTEDELDNENLKLNLKAKIKDELENSDREQLILLKENKQNIIDFLISNKDSIKIEDLKIYEPIYKCYREKGNCIICNSLSNISCINCCNNNHKEVWLCTSHWQQHSIKEHN